MPYMSANRNPLLFDGKLHSDSLLHWWRVYKSRSTECCSGFWFRFSSLSVLWSNRSNPQMAGKHIFAGWNESFYRLYMEACICIITTHGLTNCLIDICSDSLDLIQTATSWIQGWKDRGWKMGKNKKCNNIDLLEGIWFYSTKYHVSWRHACSFTPTETLQWIFRWILERLGRLENKQSLEGNPPNAIK